VSNRIATPPTLVREATALDAEAIARVRVLSWQSAYRGIIDDSVLDALSVDTDRDRWLRRLGAAAGGAGFTRVVAGPQGRVVGFASAGPARLRGEPHCGEVCLLYLVPAAQRQGSGTRLMQSMARGLHARGMRSLVVWVLARNAAARSFYARLGGCESATRDIRLGAQRLEEVACRWDSLEPLLRG